MDVTLLRTTTTTVATQTIAVTTNVVNTGIRGVQRNGTHRAVNVHGRLMYDEIVINDVWINAILSTLALSCAACVCLCFLYCKFQQWKHAVQQRRNEKNSQKYDEESLPSYTIVTGLPTYDEAVERMKRLSSSTAATSCKSVAMATGKQQHSAAAAVHHKTAAVSVVHLKNERTQPPKPDRKFGVVSHSLFVHDAGCNHCLSVQELLETYDVR